MDRLAPLSFVISAGLHLGVLSLLTIGVPGSNQEGLDGYPVTLVQLGEPDGEVTPTQTMKARSQPTKMLKAKDALERRTEERLVKAEGIRGVPSGSQGGEIGGGISRAEILDAPTPHYPTAARRAGFEGRVVLDVAISVEGSVREALVEESSGRGDCDQSAVKTLVEEWRFRPAARGGFPIESRERVVVVYSLRQKG